MQTIVVGNIHGLRPGKNAIVAPVTRADRGRIGTVWRSAAEMAHGTSVDEVNHFGRPPITVEVLSIQLTEVSKLTDSDFQSLGYTDRADYMTDWGDMFGPRVWLYRIEYLFNYTPGQVS